MSAKCKHLSVAKTMRNIERLPRTIREKALQRLNANTPARHASEREGRRLAEEGKGDIALTKADWKDMAIMVAHGMSYRSVERTFHQKPDSGMDAYRCVSRILKEDKGLRKRVRAIARETGRPLPKV